MIVLDTNVVSELMRTAPDRAVLRWVDSHPPADLRLTAMTAAELLAGVAVLPDGARKRRLGGLIERVLTELFEGRVLAFDDEAAVAYADVVRRRRLLGTPIAAADAVIAATCLGHGVELLATRDTRGFQNLGLTLVDPWSTGERLSPS